MGCRSRSRPAPATRRRPPRPAEGAPAQHPADHAGKPGAAAQPDARAGDLRRPALHRGRRDPRPGRHQAGRPAGALPGPAERAGARGAPGRAVGHGRLQGGDRGLCRLRRPGAAGRGGRGRPAGAAKSAERGSRALVRPHGPGLRRRHPGPHPRGRHDHRVRQHPRAGRAAVPGAVEAERRDAADRAAPRQPGHRPAAPGGGRDGARRPARGGGDRPRWTWASTGAASTR